MKTTDRPLSPFFHILCGVRNLERPTTVKTRNSMSRHLKNPPVFLLVVALNSEAIQLHWQWLRGRSQAMEPDKTVLKALLCHLVAMYPLTSS